MACWRKQELSKIIIRKEDLGKVPDQFPEMKCRGRIYSKGGIPYMPYYPAHSVWLYFANLKKDKMRAVKID